jgi:hypothetical protein
MSSPRNLGFEALRRRESFWVLLLFVLLTIVAAWNIVTDLDGVIVGRDNDVYINQWADWWTYKAITDPATSLWRSDEMYYPIGADLIYHSFSHLNTAVSLGLRPFIGTLPAYNIAILLNYVLAGLSMFHLGRYLTDSSVAGILAGIVFAFNSHNMYQSSHPVLVSVWCFPWMTLFFMRAVRENSIKLALLAAVFVFLGAATSTILVILMAFWMGILVLYMFFAKQLPRPSWKILLAFGMASGLLVLPTVWALLVDAVAGGNGNFITSPEESIRTDMISPIVPHWYKWLERGMYLGIMPLFLVMLAAGRRRKQAVLWFLLACVAYLFAIGPEPHFANFRLGVVLPWTLPIAPVLRNMYRMMILMSLGVAMITAYGWLGLRQSLLSLTNRRQGAIACMVGLAIFVDYTVGPFPSTPATVSTFYTDYLDHVPRDVALAIVPTGRQADKRYLYYQTLHEHPMTGGHISRAGEDVYAFINSNPLLRFGAVDMEPVPVPGDPVAALQQLAEANVGYFIIDKTLTEDLDVWRVNLPLAPVFEDDFLLVYSTGLLDASLQAQLSYGPFVNLTERSSAPTTLSWAGQQIEVYGR